MHSATNRIRVYHAPHDVGGNAYHLAHAECGYGFESRNLVYTKQWFGYPADICLKLKQDSDPTRYLRWWWAMARVGLTADVLHFNFGSSFLSYYPRQYVLADLPAWRALRIATFVTFQGCDSRISSYVTANLENNGCAQCRSREFCGTSYDHFKTEVIRQTLRYFDQVFALNPDLLRNIPNGTFLPYANCDLDDWTPPADFDWQHRGPVRIVHAPTWREVKGTDAILAAVDALKAEGHDVEFVLIEKIPHDKVRAIYASADILIDQVHVGWYGGLAVELMALGKPVVAYIRRDDLQFIPRAMAEELPVVSADPATLRDVLRPLVSDARQRQELGLRSRRFVENWHHPRYVAGLTTAAYRRALESWPADHGQSEPSQDAAGRHPSHTAVLRNRLSLLFRSPSPSPRTLPRDAARGA